MTEMEKRLVEELQKTVNLIKEYREEGYKEFEHFTMDQHRMEAAFVERVTGKKVIVNMWTVELEEA